MPESPNPKIVCSLNSSMGLGLLVILQVNTLQNILTSKNKHGLRILLEYYYIGKMPPPPPPPISYTYMDDELFKSPKYVRASMQTTSSVGPWGQVIYL